MPKQMSPDVVEVPRTCWRCWSCLPWFAEGVMAEWADRTGPTYAAHEFARAVLDRYDHTEAVPPRPELVRTPLPSDMSTRLDAMMAGLGVEPKKKHRPRGNDAPMTASSSRAWHRLD